MGKILAEGETVFQESLKKPVARPTGELLTLHPPPLARDDKVVTHVYNILQHFFYVPPNTC